MIKRGLHFLKEFLSEYIAHRKYLPKNNFCNTLIKANNTLFNPMLKRSEISFGIYLCKI